MHEPIESHVEDYLRRSDSTSLPAGFTSHLMSCSECRAELSAMEKHTVVIRALRPAAEAEPSAGFYARVLERIDAQRPVSFWTIFLQPFGRRLAVAALAFALVMGVYLVTTEPGMSSAVVAENPLGGVLPDEDQPARVLGANTDRDREVVFVNLATYRQQ